MLNTYSKIYLHYIFSPKNRMALIDPSFEEELYKVIAGIIRNLNQTLIQINGMPDHVHILVRLRPALAPSVLIQKIKSNSSKWINDKKFIKHKFEWQTGGAVFSVDHRSIEKNKQYIIKQKEHHSKKTFREEYLLMLNAYGISFEKDYLLKFFE